ncbi:hypothetical protein A2673_03070 [Candidatus Kaiserbacteria bacterium RIFCSPHIGHO2_01_FULL_50_13]|uniref:Uncharacterized protein n=1 Tax=Candidatus Kaiserbacteria bacterium RIFCSPLOWO2_01_FULL_50_24 TaxID=1798507 RepID=A0A1F6ERF1_9BACT|nr:MAG: hypothetical protein A2673_03070 [Candidatus Kaiserbacteria bacterium RIFCSPHIGHO2_01_FULL_50_13]OGG76205.1 MAG: hypothetical protein A3A34_01805 [Candidatus Kaiserbacteria bacterium RIFCSPLOWO2_01_FULL_50_24]OGG81120.1 MAG: hypothetical protein A3H74_01535 [Candidatus Kaiserbacteria bacterium RIFCSPLOWO2_02_FULL_51_13]
MCRSEKISEVAEGSFQKNNLSYKKTSDILQTTNVRYVDNSVDSVDNGQFYKIHFPIHREK